MSSMLKRVLLCAAVLAVLPLTVWPETSVVRTERFDNQAVGPDGDTEFTVSVAALLVTVPALFVTTTVYDPASLDCTFARLSVDDVAPLMFAPPFCH